MKVLLMMVLFVITIQIVYNFAPGIAMALVGVGVVYAITDFSP